MRQGGWVPRREERSSGHTFVELIMSAVIVTLVATMLLVGSSALRRESVVRRAADEFAGFIRETGTRALNGVKEPSCGAAPVCSQYVVRITRNTGTYTRQAVGGGTLETRSLPPGALFVHTRNWTLKYTPPTLDVQPFVHTALIRYGRVTGPPIGWKVCLSSIGTVVVIKEGTVTCP